MCVSKCLRLQTAQVRIKGWFYSSLANYDVSHPQGQPEEALGVRQCFHRAGMEKLRLLRRSSVVTARVYSHDCEANFEKERTGGAFQHGKRRSARTPC